MCGAVPTIIQLSWSLLSIAQLEKQQIKDMRLSDLLLSLFLFNNHERRVDFKKGWFLMFSGFNKTIIPITWVFLCLICNTMAQKHKTLPLLAPSGALIAIPTYYWSSTHFFRSHWSSLKIGPQPYSTFWNICN